MAPDALARHADALLNWAWANVNICKAMLDDPEREHGALGFLPDRTLLYSLDSSLQT